MSVGAQVTIGILTVIIAIFVATAFFFAGAMRPFNGSRAQVIKIAKSQANLKTPQAYGIATTNETTYAVVGLDKSGKEIGVIVPQDNKKLTVVELAKGISPEKLKTSDTQSIVLGLYKNKPIWEVNNRSGYKVYDFTTGKELI